MSPMAALPSLHNCPMVRLLSGWTGPSIQRLRSLWPPDRSLPTALPPTIGLIGIMITGLMTMGDPGGGGPAASGHASVSLHLDSRGGAVLEVWLDDEADWRQTRTVAQSVARLILTEPRETLPRVVDPDGGPLLRNGGWWAAETRLDDVYPLTPEPAFAFDPTKVVTGLHGLGYHWVDLEISSPWPATARWSRQPDDDGDHFVPAPTWSWSDVTAVGPIPTGQLTMHPDNAATGDHASATYRDPSVGSPPPPWLAPGAASTALVLTVLGAAFWRRQPVVPLVAIVVAYIGLLIAYFTYPLPSDRADLSGPHAETLREWVAATPGLGVTALILDLLIFILLVAASANRGYHPVRRPVFQPPPRWPRPPDGWIPYPGWRPDPSWPKAPFGWQFWRPRGQPPDPPRSPSGHVP